MTSALLVAAAVGLVLFAAVLAVAEVALLRTPAVRVQAALEAGDRRAGALAALLEDMPVVLNTILMVVLTVQLSAAALAGYMAQLWFGGIATTIGVVILTVTLFVYSEAIPKTLALRSPVAAALALARPVHLLVRICRGPTSLLVNFADLQTPGEGATASSAFTEEELRILAEESAHAGEIAPADVELVHRSFEFGDRRVDEVMVEREAIVAVPASASPSDALAVAIRAGHRRMPVHRGDLDGVVGCVRLRDLARAVDAASPAVVEGLVRPVLRVRSDALIADLLDRMQRSGPRLALVVDGDGRVRGLVTIEDIVAELLGEIDELD